MYGWKTARQGRTSLGKATMRSSLNVSITRRGQVCSKHLSDNIGRRSYCPVRCPNKPVERMPDRVEGARRFL